VRICVELDVSKKGSRGFVLNRSAEIAIRVGIPFILVDINAAIFWTIFRVFIYDIGGSFTQIALISLIEGLFTIFLSPFWGTLSDLIGRRKPFIIIGSLSLAIFSPLFVIARSVVQYLIIFTAASFFSSMVYPCLNATLTEATEEAERGKTLGYFFGLNAIGWTLGSFLSGYLADVWGIAYVFISAGLVGGVGAFVALFFMQESGGKSITAVSMRDAFQRVLGSFVVERNPSLFVLMGTIILYGLGSGVFSTLFQIKFFESVKRSYLIYGIVSALSGLGSIIAPPIYGYFADKVGKKEVFQATLLAYTMYFIVMGLTWDPLILAILWFLPLWPGVRISSIALATELARKDEVGQYQGFVESSSALAGAIGAIIGGLIADYLNARENLYILDYILMGSAIGPFLATILVSALKISKTEPIKLD